MYCSGTQNPSAVKRLSHLKEKRNLEYILLPRDFLKSHISTVQLEFDIDRSLKRTGCTTSTVEMSTLVDCPKRTDKITFNTLLMKFDPCCYMAYIYVCTYRH